MKDYILLIEAKETPMYTNVAPQPPRQTPKEDEGEVTVTIY